MSDSPAITVDHAIIGMLLNEPDTYIPIIKGAGITPDMMEDRFLQAVYTSINELYELIEDFPDMIMVMDDLINKNLFDMDNRITWNAMTDVFATEEKFRGWIRVFINNKRNALQRQAYGFLGLIQNDTPQDEVEELKQRHAELMEQAERLTYKESKGIKDALLRVEQNIDRMFSGERPQIAFEFGELTDMKEMFGGAQRHELVIISARPGVGKTSLLTQSITHNLKRGKRGLLISLEMSAEKILNRIICQEAGVNHRRLYDHEEMRVRYKACYEIMKPMIETQLDIQSESDINKINAYVEKQCTEKGLDFIAIDYLQLVDGMDGKKGRAEQIGQVSRMFKKWTIKFDTPVIALAQINRSSESENRMPRMSDLRESGSIEQDADWVILGHLPQMNSEKEDQKNLPQQEVALIVAKNRDGATGSINVIFKRSTTTFMNWARQ